jgi:hypothetical protein
MFRRLHRPSRTAMVRISASGSSDESVRPRARAVGREELGYQRSLGGVAMSEQEVPTSSAKKVPVG